MRSQNLHFIRGVGSSDAVTCFETWTDVWVFGDVRGYEYARSMILNAKGAQKAIKLDAPSHNSHSMRVLIFPASRRPITRPRVKLFERVIFDRDRLNMELIVNGNCTGYDCLAAVFQRVIDEPGDPSDHQHVDDSPGPGRWVLPRSVSLNVRHPLSNWDIENLGPYKGMVTESARDFSSRVSPDSRSSRAVSIDFGGRFPFPFDLSDRHG